MQICTTLQGGRWQDILRLHLKPEEIERLDKLPNTQLLSAIHLRIAVGPHRTQPLLNKAKPILCEIDLNGKRRCMFIHPNGVRCDKYTASGMCGDHMPSVKTSTPFFKSQTLNDQYLKYLKDPRKQTLDREVALLRLMTQKALDYVQNDNVPLQIIEAVTVMVDKTKQMVEAMSKLNQLTPETVDNILNAVVKIMEKYVSPENLEAAASEISALNLTEPVSEVLPDPGVEMVIDGQVQKIEAIDTDKKIQQRALLETYGGELSPENRATLEAMINANQSS